MRQNDVYSKLYFAAEGGGIKFAQLHKIGVLKKYSLAAFAAKEYLR